MQGITFAENLVTPHSLKLDGENAQPLLEMINPEGIKDELQNFQDVDEYESAALAAADFITAQVREALWFPEKLYNRDDFATFGISLPV